MTQSESQTLELKSQWSDECLKAISALANSKGGALVIGLNDKGQPIDLKNAGKLLEDVPNIDRALSEFFAGKSQEQQAGK